MFYICVLASATRPQFTQKLEGQTVNEGESVRFQVRVAGKPLPEVTWYREGMPIVSSPDFNITQEGDLHTLYIPEVFPEDSGRFTVRVVSASGQAESSADLLVKGILIVSILEISVARMLLIFIHSGNIYSTHARSLLRDTPSQAVISK